MQYVENWSYLNKFFVKILHVGYIGELYLLNRHVFTFSQR